MALYVSPTAFKASASIPDGLAEDDVALALGAASRAVEQLCQRRSFALDAAPSTRKYTAINQRLVNIDDLASLVEVRSDGVALAEGTDYVLEPENAWADDRPVMWLHADSDAFSASRQGVEVEGTFGWPVVPEQVEQFVTIIASKLLKRTREAPFGIATAGGMDGYAIRLAKNDPDALLLIDPLVRNYPVVL